MPLYKVTPKPPISQQRALQIDLPAGDQILEVGTLERFVEKIKCHDALAC